MRYITTVALGIKGDRFEKGAEIELTAEEAAMFDPSDLVPAGSVAAPSAEVPATDVSIEDMSLAQLKARAKELGLATTGSKADIQERITLHIADGGSAASEG